MKNFPYSKPETRQVANRIVVNSVRRARQSDSLWIYLFLVLIGGAFIFLGTQSGDVPHFRLAYAIIKSQAASIKSHWTTEDGSESERTPIQLPETKPVALPQPVAPNPSLDMLSLPMEYNSPHFTREDFLSDRFNRVPDLFSVPEGLEDRVGFWFDIYTKYSSRYNIIHHVEYPWLIFKIIDTSPIHMSNEHRWTKYHRAENAVRRAMLTVRNDLLKMARMKRFDKLTKDQQRYFDLLSDLPGPRPRVFAHAANQLRSQLGQKDFFRNGLTSASKYLPKMEEIFAQYDLPVEITRLPLVESSFNEKAISKVGASGIWQFMPSIGKAFLKINNSIDERNSPLKATEAAARLMLSNFRILKSWPLAITAYNHGPGGLLKASRRLKTTDIATIINKYNGAAFGFASSNFFPSYLAALHAERYQEEIFGPIFKYPAHESDSLVLSLNIRAGTLTSVTGITMEELRLFNQDLKTRAVREQTVLPRGYRLFLPMGRRARLELYQMELKESMNSTRRGQPRRQSKISSLDFDSQNL